MAYSHHPLLPDTHPARGFALLLGLLKRCRNNSPRAIRQPLTVLNRMISFSCSSCADVYAIITARFLPFLLLPIPARANPQGYRRQSAHGVNPRLGTSSLHGYHPLFISTLTTFHTSFIMALGSSSSADSGL